MYDQLIAKCYLTYEGDEANLCVLSEEYLHIKQNDRLESFHLDSIQTITFKQKLLLFPVIFGGILSPLALLAVFNNIFHIWLMMTLAAIGMLLIYYGFTGTRTLSILTNVKEYDFFLKQPPSNQLIAFTRFTLRFRYTQDLHYYFVMPNKEWLQFQESGTFQKKPLTLSETRLTAGENEVLLSLKPFSSGVEIKYKAIAPNSTTLVPVTESTIQIADISEMDGLV